MADLRMPGYLSTDTLSTNDSLEYNGTLWLPKSFAERADNLLTTRGDIMRRGASTCERLALGTTGQVLTSDGTDAAWATPASGGGLTSTNPPEVREAGQGSWPDPSFVGVVENDGTDDTLSFGVSFASYPTGTVAGDIAIVFFSLNTSSAHLQMTAGQYQPFPTYGAWKAVDDDLSLGTYVFGMMWKRLNNRDIYRGDTIGRAETFKLIDEAGAPDELHAFMVTVRGLDPANPFDVKASIDQATATTSWSQATGLTTTVNNCLLLAFTGAESTGEIGFSAQTIGGNSMTEQIDGESVSISSYLQASAGAVGTFTATCASALSGAILVVACRPPQGFVIPAMTIATADAGGGNVAPIVFEEDTGLIRTLDWNERGQFLSYGSQGQGGSQDPEDVREFLERIPGWSSSHHWYIDHFQRGRDWASDEIWERCGTAKNLSVLQNGNGYAYASNESGAASTFHGWMSSTLNTAGQIGAVACRVALTMDDDSTSVFAGCFFRHDGASTRRVSLDITGETSAIGRILGNVWSADTTRAATFGSSPNESGRGYVYLALVQTANTDIDAYWSGDGVTWCYYGTYTNASYDQHDQFGFGVFMNDASAYYSVSFDWVAISNGTVG